MQLLKLVVMLVEQGGVVPVTVPAREFEFHQLLLKPRVPQFDFGGGRSWTGVMLDAAAGQAGQ